MVSSMSRKKSAIWLFFSVAEDTKYALCSACKQKVARGGSTTKSFNTSNLVSHLKSRHPVEFKVYNEKQKSSRVDSQITKQVKQLTLHCNFLSS